MTEYELIHLFSDGFGFGLVFFMLVLIYWRQK